MAETRDMPSGRTHGPRSEGEKMPYWKDMPEPLSVNPGGKSMEMSSCNSLCPPLCGIVMVSSWSSSDG